MVLLLVFAMMLLGLFALFLGGGLIAQGYLYQNPADKMPIRALIAAAIVAGFVTLWVRIDQNAPGRYDTLFNFAGTSTAEIKEFEAVRWAGTSGKLKLDANGNYIESTVKYKRGAGGQGANFFDETTGNKFELSGSTFMTGAIRVKGPTDTEPVRYNAMLKPDKPKTNPEYAQERRFVEEKGSRYLEMHQLGTLFVPSTGAVLIALSLNFLLFVVWLIAFWPVMRFSFLHAILFTGAFALLTMVAVMPILFKQNRDARGVQPAALVVELNDLRA